MKYDEFKQVCLNASSERFNYLCFDTTINENEGKYLFFNESKDTKFNAFTKVKLFSVLNVISN